jgi:hypothetical protein
MSPIRKFTLAALSLLATTVGVFAFATAPALAAHAFSGSLEAPLGGFHDPLGLGVAPSGEVVVGDFETNVVDICAPLTGKCTSEFPVAATDSYQLAVDDSRSASKGDVYVANYGGNSIVKYNLSGEIKGEITEDVSAPTGVAVDSTGDVYVVNSGTGKVSKYGPAGELIAPELIKENLTPTPQSIAVGPTGAIYVAGENGIREYNATGECQKSCAAFGGEATFTLGIAVGPEGDVYATPRESEIAVFTSTGTPVEKFDPAHIIASAYGIAVSGTTVYATNFAANEVAVFIPGQPLSAKTQPATEVTATSAKLHAKVKLEGGGTIHYHFKYGKTTSYESETAAEEVTVISGADEAEVTTEITGLEAGTAYDFKIVATDTVPESAEGANETLATAGRPIVVGESVSAVSSAAATLEAVVNPNGLETTCAFEFSTEGAEGPAGKLEGTIVKAPCVPPSLGTGDSGVGASLALSGLKAGETYYYRVVAENAQSTAELKPAKGEVKTFTTVPVPATEAPNPIGSTTATFLGKLTPLNLTVPTEYFFYYNLSNIVTEPTPVCKDESRTEPTESAGIIGAGTEDVSTAWTGLQPNHEYTVCLVSANSFGSVEDSASPAVTFKTLPAPPKIESESTSEPTSSGSTSGAKLEAQVNPNNQETTYRFEYSTTEAGGVLQAPITSRGLSALSAGYGNQLASVVVTGLEPDTTYYYRVVAENADHEKEEGTVQPFTTSPAAPLVGAGVANSITDRTVALTGTVNPEGAETQYHVVYVNAASYEPGAAGERDAYSKGASTLEASISAGNTAVAVGPLELVNLAPGTTYDYALVATNSLGTKIGPNQTFTTASHPPILGSATVSGVTDSAASISTTLEPQGLQTRWELRLGTTPGGLLYQAAGSTTGAGTEPIAVNASSLTPGTTYYYKLTATNPDGSVETPEGSFTTAPAPAPANINLFATPPVLSIPANVFPAEETGTTGKTTNKGLSKAQKLKNALKACKKDKSKSKRAACEKAAHKKYGATTKKKK